MIDYLPEKSRKEPRLRSRFLLITLAPRKQTKRPSMHSADTIQRTPFGLCCSYICAIRSLEYGAATKDSPPPPPTPHQNEQIQHDRQWQEMKGENHELLLGDN